MENPDFFCIKCLVNGDEKAFVTLYHKYHQKIYYSALKLTKSEILAQDVTQDVFLKIWNNRKSLDPDQNFAAYISIICRNVIFDIFKKATQEEKIRKELQQFTDIHDFTDTDDDFFENYQNLLDAAIQNLPPQRRMIFERCKLQKQSYDTIAISLGISRSTIQDHIVKANKSIRDYIQANGNFSHAILFVILSEMIS